MVLHLPTVIQPDCEFEVFGDPQQALKDGLEPKGINTLSQPTGMGNNTSRLFPGSQNHNVSGGKMTPVIVSNTSNVTVTIDGCFLFSKLQ